MKGMHRTLRVVRGARAETAEAAAELVAEIPLEQVLWVGDDAPTGVRNTDRTEVRRMLGGSFLAVVLDLHARVDPDLLGQCHGFVWGGGVLALRLPLSPPPAPHLAVHAVDPSDVTTRFWERIASLEDRAGPVRTEPPEVEGNEEQRDLVATLRARLAGERSCSIVLADRGRGKSAALGLALRDVEGAVVCGSSRAACHEVLRFAPEGTAYRTPDALWREDAPWRAIVVDEAAQLPVPLLRRIVRAHPDAHLAFASTVRGYEGTGRGFLLSFLKWLEGEREVTRFTLEEPIRWAREDPVERAVMDALLLDATPSYDDRRDLRKVDRGALPEDELRRLFGLLVHAHYRTTPGDLQRMLDAPNLAVHAAGDVAAATLVAREGGLDAATVEAMATGKMRIRGHALPDTLVSHCGRREAGSMRILRSVRIATHPELRRSGVASELVNHVHDSYDVDLFGTLFGATPGLLRFRRSVGYELVRVGASRGVRTGEPTAVMVRPVSREAGAMFEALRRALSRDLPLQLRLMAQELPLDTSLIESLRAGLPDPAPLTKEVLQEAVAAYAFGPRPYEASALAIGAWVEARAAKLAALEDPLRTLVKHRILEHRPWPEVVEATGMPSVPAAMRAMRRGVQRLR